MPLLVTGGEGFIRANIVLNALPTSFSSPELNVACAEGELHSVTRALQAQAASAFNAPA